MIYSSAMGGSSVDYDKAIYYYKKCMAIDPRKDNSYLVAIGIVYWMKKDYEYSIEYLKKAVEIDDQDANAYEKLALSYVGKGDYQTAIYYGKKSDEITPKRNGLYYTYIEIANRCFDMRDNNLFDYYHQKAKEAKH